MEYTDYPTKSNKPMDDLTEEEARHELLVRVLYEAMGRTVDPMLSPREKHFGNMVVTAIEDLTGDQFDTLFEDARSYGMFHARRMAKKHGMTLDEFLGMIDAMPEDDSLSDLMKYLNEENEDFKLDSGPTFDA